MQPSKPCSEASERNKEPILGALQGILPATGLVLEIGSGTGQHAVHFGAALPGLTWQTSDLPLNHDGIHLWLEESHLPNVLPPLLLDVAREPWPIARADAVYSANTAHIMSLPEVEAMFRGVGNLLQPGGRFLLYGPFRFGGRHNSDSNARFDAALRRQDPRMGVRDVETLATFAADAGLVLERQISLPANNRLLVWTRTA